MQQCSFVFEIIAKMAKKEKEIVVSYKFYKQLTDALTKLDALEAMGVNNWKGYEEAMVIYEEMLETAKELN